MTQNPTAAAPDAAMVQAAQTSQDKKSKREHAIQEMEKHLSVAKDGTVVLGVKSATDIQVDPDSFNELSQSLQAMNQLLRSGQLHASQIHLKTAIPATAAAAAAAEPDVTAAGVCYGSDYFNTYWWGMYLLTDECKTRDIINDCLSGSGALSAIAAILALIPGCQQLSFLMKLAGLVLGAGGSYMNFIDSLGSDHGLEFSITWLFIISWVWHQ